MKKWILHSLLVGMLGILSASCSREADEPTMGGKVQVKFIIALDSPSAASRATWGDYVDREDIANEFDNRINPNQLFVNLTLDGKEYTVRNLLYWQATEENIYEFVGEVEGVVTAIEKATVRIEVYANCISGQETFTTNVAYIPMWGVQTATISLTPGTLTELEEPIYLLRAMAKVEITMADKDYTLTNVTLNKYNTIGNYLPSRAADVDNTTDLHYDNEDGYCFNPNTSEGTNLEFTVTNNHLVFYLPEVANTVGQGELKMTVTLKKGDEIVNWIMDPSLYFRTYADGNATNTTPFDVVRNHWYQYTITEVSDEVTKELKYDVVKSGSMNITVPTFE